MEVRIRYKQKNKSETGSNEGHTAGIKKDVEHDGSTQPQQEVDSLLKRMYHFTDSQLAELKGAFAEIDRSGSGTIPAHHLGTVLRIMGQVPTDAEVQDMLQEAVLDDTGSLNMDEYLRLIGTRGLQSHQELEHDLGDALRYFDREGRGLLDAEHLKTALTTHGERLDNDDMAEMMRMADIKGDGRIDYLELMRKMMSK